MERLFVPCAEGLHEDCCVEIVRSARSGRNVAAPLAITGRDLCSCACHVADSTVAAAGPGMVVGGQEVRS